MYSRTNQNFNRAKPTAIYINRALENVPQSVLPHLSTFGSASVSYRYDWQGVVYASMSILDIPRSLQYSYPFVFPMHGSMGMEHEPASTMMEGLLWSYSRYSEAFLSLANSSPNDMNVELRVLEDGGASGEDRFTVPAGNTVLKTVRIRREDGWNPTIGGLRIVFDADSDSLSVVGGIEDDAHGYSTNIPVAALPAANNIRMKTSLASTGMMAGKQDPMMGFPDNLRFEPYAYFRNIGDSAIRLSSSVYYDRNGKAHSSALPELFIPPHQSRELAIAEALRGIDTGSITLAYSYTGTPNALLAATGSVDQTGNYVFEVEPRGVAQTASKSAIYWLMANGFDTMYSFWNPSKQPQDLLLTFRYGIGQTYEHPVHLEPSGTAMVDIMQLAEMGMPDRNGHVLPVSATEGSLVVSAGNGSEYDPISVAVAGGIYNPKTATCNPTCETCNGCANIPSSLTPNPIMDAIATSGFLYAQCSWYNGTQYTYSNGANWSSNNTGIATVQTKGQSNPGLTYGAGAGSATISSFAQSIPTNAGQICGSPAPPACPVAAPAQSGPAIINSLVCSPSTVTRGSSVTCTLQGPGTTSNWKFTSSSSGATVTSATGSSSTTWSGTMVDSGTVTATATNSGKTATITASINVTPRNWALPTYTATQVNNGDPTIGITLPTPPQPSGNDSGLGRFHVQFTDQGFGATAISSGPNQGYSYLATNLNISAGYFHYEINPDLLNSTSVFSQHQCGSSGFISWSNLYTQTIRHESGATGSHYSEYLTAFTANNPGTYFEAQVANPAANAQTFFANVRAQINSSYTSIGTAAGQENIPPVNYSQANVFLGNINYPINGGYTPCN